MDIHKQEINNKMVSHTYHVTTGGEAAIILQSNLAICPSVTVQVRGLRTNRGIASRRSEKKKKCHIFQELYL